MANGTPVRLRAPTRAREPRGISNTRGSKGFSPCGVRCQPANSHRLKQLANVDGPGMLVGLVAQLLRECGQ